MDEGAGRVEQQAPVRGGAEPPGWPSVLDSVVVYAAGALCRRRARVTVPAGRRLRLTGLPRVLDGRSLRARVVDGPPGAGVTEARVVPVAAIRAPEELPELRQRLDEARERESALRERLRLVRESAAATAALRAVPPPRREDEPHRRTPAEAWLELAEFVDERLARLQERVEGLTRELERAEHETLVLTDRLERSSNAGPAEPVETSATVQLTLAGAEPGTELDLELEYGVPAARWLPAYRLSYRQGADGGRLVLRAAVAQRTGEDWTGVRLALSTADLQRRTDLPKLNSLRIGRSQPAPAPSGWREAPSGLSDLFAGFDAAGPRPGPRPRAGGRRPGARPGGPAAAAAVSVGPVSPAGAPGRGGTLEADEHRIAPPFPQPPPMPVAALPVAPMPAAPMPAAAPPPQAPGFAGYGAPPPAPAAPGGLPRSARRRTAAPRSVGVAAQADHEVDLFGGGGTVADFGGPAAEAPAGPPVPGAALLDYPALVLSGAEESAARRGRLHPAAGSGSGSGPNFGSGSPGGADGLDLPLPRHAVPPRVSAGSFDHRFDATAPADIPSDGTWHTVTVGEIPVALQPEYVTVPSVEEKVYGTLLISNSTPQAILAGPVEVTVDGDYLLTAGLPTLAPGGTRRLGLGVTESIEVARRTELRESTAGMLNTSTVLDHRVHVELANRLGRPVTVEVRERVPVASDSEVRIEERADWRAPAEPSAEVPASTRFWRVELPPGGRTELHGGFEIRIPAGKAIVGGNRRN